MTIRQRWKQTALHNKLLVIIAALGLVPLVFQALRYFGAPPDSPVLHVSPSVRDAHIRWENGEFSPRPEQGGDPFVLKIKNIGDRKAVNLTIRFVFNLDTDELIKMAQKSPLFSSKPIEGDAKSLTIPTRSSLSEATAAQINFTEDNVIRRAEIPADNEITVHYPPGIKNEISLWLLITSYSQATAWRAKEKDSIHPSDPNLIMKYLKDENQEAQRARILVLPDITITIFYHDIQQNTLSTTDTIRLIYDCRWLDTSAARWTRDERPRRLSKGDLVNAWLVFNHIDAHAPGDYRVVQPEGGDEKIETWNVAKLGAEPTEGQLFFMIPFIREHQQVLSGGEGVLSFEDENNPSEGWYNIYKTQGLFIPFTH